MRDTFTAGGQISLEVGGRVFGKVPKIFLHFKQDAYIVLKTIATVPEEILVEFWGCSPPSTAEGRLKLWLDMVKRHSKSTLPSEFNIKRLFHESVEEKEQISVL